MSGKVRTRPLVRSGALGSAVAIGAALLAGVPAAASPDTATVYAVVQEGLTVDEGAELAQAFGVANALQSTGAFSYVDSAAFGKVPSNMVGDGQDESGRATVSEALDSAAIEQLKPPADEEALRVGDRLVELARLSPDLKPTPSVSHNELTLTDKDGREVGTHALDTAVSYQFTLGGLPVAGQGAKLRLTLAPDGTVSQLSHSLRKLAPAGEVPVISVDEAQRQCAALYGPTVGQDPPTLGYQFPELSATDAQGRGTVQTIFPQYTCNPIVEAGTQAHRLLPAVPDSAPTATITVSRNGDSIDGTASVSGGTGPYTYHWSSSTTELSGAAGSGDTVSYRRQPRESKDPAEQVTLEVTDANGLATTATVELLGDGTVTAESVPGGGGFGALAIGPTDVGIENTVDEWACAQASANGFHNVMTSHGVPAAFDWRGMNAWEWDFKDQNQGGGDQVYVDNVDAQWYTGHGAPGVITFKSNITDHYLYASEARWGDGDLEWMQLESCQVLANPATWVQSFRGLHLLNGFVTNAYCVGGGTGGTFANYLFPQKFLWWTLRPALTVRSAWANMALDKEPSGVKYRTMGPIGPGGVTNINDYFWGQGSVGPDITPATATGYWYLTGTV